MAVDVAEVVFHTGDEGSTLVVSKPASFAAGQILLAFAVSNSTSLASLTAEEGWAEEGTVTVSNHQGKVWSHVHDSGDPATWDFGYGSNLLAFALIRITGAATTPTVLVQTTAQVALTASVDSPTITPDGTDDLLIVALANNSDNNAASATVPAGTTTLGSTQLIGAYQALFLAEELLASGAATGVRTWTDVAPTAHQGSTWSITVAAAAGGGATVSGTAAASLGALTATAAGTPTTHGTAAASLGAITAAATGTPTTFGVATAALGALTVTAAGEGAVTGTALANLGTLAAVAAGTRTIRGTAAAAYILTAIALVDEAEPATFSSVTTAPGFSITTTASMFTATTAAATFTSTSAGGDV